MIERYTRPEMARLWTDEYRFEKMLEVELLASEALVHQKQVPAAALAKRSHESGRERVNE